MTFYRQLISFQYVFVLVLLALSLPGLKDTVQAQEEYGGAPFSDPGNTFTMPQEWQNKTITYRQEEAMSDIVISLDQHLYPALLPLIDAYAKKKQPDNYDKPRDLWYIL